MVLFAKKDNIDMPVGTVESYQCCLRCGVHYDKSHVFDALFENQVFLEKPIDSSKNGRNLMYIERDFASNTGMVALYICREQLLGGIEMYVYTEIRIK